MIIKTKAENMNTQRGSSLLEVILAIALSLVLVPFMYNQIADMNDAVKNVAIANRIVKSKTDVINYVRRNQDAFNVGNDGTVIDNKDLVAIAPLAHTGWVFKTESQGSQMAEVFLAYTLDSDYKAANVAKYIGNDAAIVSSDKVAYSQNWAIGGSGDVEFTPGDIIFRINQDLGGGDKNKFLHRGTFGGDTLNMMQRNLHLNRFDIYNIAKITGEYIYATSAATKILYSGLVRAEFVNFLNGAELLPKNGNDSLKEENILNVHSLFVGGDIVGFSNIDVFDVESKVEIKAKRVDVTDAVNVSGGMTLNEAASLKFNTITSVGDVYADSVNTEWLMSERVIVSNDGICKGRGVEDDFCVRLEIGSWKYPDAKNNKTVPTFSKKNIKINDVLLGDYSDALEGYGNTLYDKIFYPK